MAPGALKPPEPNPPIPQHANGSPQKPDPNAGVILAPKVGRVPPRQLGNPDPRGGMPPPVHSRGGEPQMASLGDPYTEQLSYGQAAHQANPVRTRLSNARALSSTQRPLFLGVVTQSGPAA